MIKHRVLTHHRTNTANRRLYWSWC